MQQNVKKIRLYFFKYEKWNKDAVLLKFIFVLFSSDAHILHSSECKGYNFNCIMYDNQSDKHVRNLI